MTADRDAQQAEGEVPEKPNIEQMSDLNALGTMIDAYDALAAENARLRQRLAEAYALFKKATGYTIEEYGAMLKEVKNG